MFCGPSTFVVHKTYCFPRSQSISVNCSITSLVTAGLTILPTNICTHQIRNLLYAMDSSITKL